MMRPTIWSKWLKMLIPLSLLSPFFILGGTAIECYSCYVKPPPRAPGSPMPDFDRLCSAFDQSDQYVVNCTQSTLCVTRTFTLEHRQESKVSSIMIVERGCAMQAYEHQALVRGKWRTIIDIMEEAYQTGCVTDREWAGSLASDTEYCYCDTDRCNEKMGRAQERLNETQSVGPSNLEHQQGYYQYNYHSDEGIKSGHRKIKLSRIVNIFIFISLCCIFQ